MWKKLPPKFSMCGAIGRYVTDIGKFTDFQAFIILILIFRNYRLQTVHSILTSEFRKYIYSMHAFSCSKCLPAKYPLWVRLLYSKAENIMLLE